MLQEQDSPPVPSTRNSVLPVSVRVSRFRGKDGVEEIQWIIRPTRYASFETQLEWVRRAYEQAVDATGLDMDTAVWRRFLCSDLLNQVQVLKRMPFSNLEDDTHPCAVSWVSQPPSNPSKVTLWAHHIHDPRKPLSKTKESGSLSLKRGALTHHWTTGVTRHDKDSSHAQTLGMFGFYNAFLESHGMTLADHVVRTWFFVQNVDADYAGLVEARNDVFEEHGLTADTHFIASTGIEGGSAEVSAKAMLDSYAISGLESRQVQYLHARDHLSPTHVYGVSFERGTAVSYRDRTHLFISGTASIDSLGDIVHPGDVFLQFERTLINIGALLAEAGATMDDLQVLIVYLRDPKDHAPMMSRMRQRFPDTPFEIVTAPVCRPGWLIEIEGMAIIANNSPSLPDF